MLNSTDNIDANYISSCSYLMMTNTLNQTTTKDSLNRKNIQDD